MEQNADLALAEKRRRQADAQARYRARRPEKVAADQRLYEARPERKARQALLRRQKRAAEGRAFRPAMSADERRRRAAERMRAHRETPAGTLNNRMAVRIAATLRGEKGGRAWRSLVGYDAAELRAHIERQFSRGMSWGRLCRGEIHIDHIVPLSSFSFGTPADAGFRAAWALTNLRPLWAKDNMRKRARRETLL